MLSNRSMVQMYYKPNQNYVKWKLSYANISWLDTVIKATTAPSLTVTTNWKLLLSTRNACMEEDTASSVLHVGSYTRMKSKRFPLLTKCKKCNHNQLQFQWYTTTIVHPHSMHQSPMTTPRASKTSSKTLSLTSATNQRATRDRTLRSVIFWVRIQWEFGATLSHTMNTHGPTWSKCEWITIL